LTLIQVEVVDAEGRRCPTALNQIDFALAGPAEWRGGIGQGPGNCILSRGLPVECGVNRVLIRSATTTGKITLTAQSSGLKPASLEFTSTAVSAADGLSRVFPAAGLPSYLGRGPTPQGPSYVVSRKAVQIAHVTAGANTDKAALSYDDDETTSWSNDGNLATAWIRYDFAAPAKVREVVMKLQNWRTTSYPIQIFVDGKSVYKGNTDRSLGYVTIPFEPTPGQSLTLSLQGVSKSEDAFNIVEVTGVRDQAAASAGDRRGRSALNIAEIEIYE
jgi:beta-galactosidase